MEVRPFFELSFVHFYKKGIFARIDTYSEALRVLKPAGTLLVVAETYECGKIDRLLEDYDKGWICGIGTRPAGV